MVPLSIPPAYLRTTMDKTSAEYSAETPAHYTSEIDSQYSSACMMDELETRSHSYVGTPVTEWGSAGRRSQQPQEGAAALCSRRMSEFAKRIEDSAESSSAWERIGGKELSHLRREFRDLLGRLLDELDQDAGEVRERYEATRILSQNGDIILAYRLACLLSSAIKRSHSRSAVRVEVGCSASHTEFSCFLGEQSAGVTMRKKDNLFALCTNGDWRTDSLENTPLLASLRMAIQNCGGQLRVDATDGVEVKASFPISI